jgi:hypothetical protein
VTSVPSARPADSAAPSTTPRSSVELEARVSESQAFSRCTADVRPLPLRGIEIYQSDLPPVGDNLVAMAKPNPRARDLESVLIDAASGRRLAVFGGVYDGDAKLQRAIVSRPGSDVQELLDLKNGTSVRPRIGTPDGAPRSWRIGLDGRTGRVWLLARTRHDTTFFGTWPEPRSTPVSLEHALPFWPDAMTSGSGVLVSNAERSCLLAEQGAHCFAARAHSQLLAGRYVLELFGGSIYDAEAQQELQLDEDCQWRLTATLEAPARALFACTSGGEVRWVVWSPEGVLARWTSGDWLSPLSPKFDTRVVPLELLVRPDAVVNHWFDLVHGRVIVTPPLVPLEPQQRFDANIVAESDGERSGIQWLDIEAATVTSIEPEVDCEQPLQWQAMSEHQALVACPKPSMAEHLFHPASRPNHYDWLELIDLRARRRLRTNQVFEATLTQTGIAVGIQPGPVSNLAALQWPATCAGN